MGIGIKIAAALALILVLVCGLSYWYYRTTQSQLALLQANNGQLTVAVQTNEATIAAMQAHETQQQQLLVDLQNRMAQANQGKQDLVAVFQKKNLTAVGQQDYKALELNINAYTQKSFDDLTTVTGGRVSTGTSQPSAGKGATNVK